MANPKKEKAQGWNLRLISKDQSPQTDQINSNNTLELSANLLLNYNLVQSLQFRFAELAMITDSPPDGVVDCANAIDEAEIALAHALRGGK